MLRPDEKQMLIKYENMLLWDKSTYCQLRLDLLVIHQNNSHQFHLIKRSPEEDKLRVGTACSLCGVVVPLAKDKFSGLNGVVAQRRGLAPPYWLLGPLPLLYGIWLLYLSSACSTNLHPFLGGPLTHRPQHCLVIRTVFRPELVFWLVLTNTQF